MPSYKPAYKYGGPVNSVSKLCELLTEKGIYTKVLTTTGNGKEELDVETGSEIIVDGVPVIYFKRYTKNNTFISPGLWRYLYHHVKEYDLVHIHTWWNIMVLFSAMICYLRGAKVIISPRGMLCDYIINGNNRFAKKCIHLLMGKSLLKQSHFHATAPIEYDECTHLIPGWQGFTVPNILPLTGPPVKKNANDVFTIAYLSRIDHKKGLEFAFEAISKLNAQLVLKIFGSGDAEYLTQLKQLAGDLKIEDKIQWMGWQTPATKFQQLMEADVCILTSYNENFGNVIVEALYMGTPVLITDMVGLSSFVEANDLGWVVPLDVDAISDAILQAMQDTEKRERINKTAREFVEANFAQDIVVNQYISQYRLLLDK